MFLKKLWEMEKNSTKWAIFRKNYKIPGEKLEIFGIPVKIPSFSILIVVVFIVFFGWPSKASSKMDRIGNAGTKLDWLWQNWGQNHLVHSEIRWK